MSSGLLRPDIGPALQTYRTITEQFRLRSRSRTLAFVFLHSRSRSRSLAFLHSRSRSRSLVFLHSRYRAPAPAFAKSHFARRIARIEGLLTHSHPSVRDTAVVYW
ncbi:hypothetical protein PILCRDRAFT_3681 [Piloderma croceum F 1598]|uniref:Uncharacterized protein n=1 Tax=Piloderma croceum (strain F 1598) TaxID=765440 RepID=A0A0C3CE22_PILCF|nr:hypothetical protein PILCRDRAFT_3681 [Piloderma croceum F 1598]